MGRKEGKERRCKGVRVKVEGEREKEEVERRVNAVVALEEKKWVGGGVDKEYAKECAKERMGRNPSVLLLDSVTAQCNLEEKTVTHR